MGTFTNSSLFIVIFYFTTEITENTEISKKYLCVLRDLRGKIKIAKRTFEIRLDLQTFNIQ